MGEATRCALAVRTASVILRDPYDGTTGGALIVNGEEIGEVHCRVEILAGRDGKRTAAK